MIDIVSPFARMAPEERAFQLWAVHPNDLDRLGYTNDAAKEANIRVPQKPSGQRTLGPRELFYLDHIKAAIEQASPPVINKE